MMDMTREAMAFVKELTEKAAPVKEPKEICGKVYTNERLFRMDEPPKAAPIQVHTLTGLMEYILGCSIEYGGMPMILHVSSPTDVVFFSFLDDERLREDLCVAQANIHSFRFDQWMGQ